MSQTVALVFAFLFAAVCFFAAVFFALRFLKIKSALLESQFREQSLEERLTDRKEQEEALRNAARAEFENLATKLIEKETKS
ncbi:MAG: hypothetical protein EOP05_21290, partial [Proteobacteria bacterium]